jgi:hypothetical protein
VTAPPDPRPTAADEPGPASGAVGAGAVAAERGWFAAARRQWQEAERAAGRSDPATAARLERLERVEAALRGMAAGRDGSTGDLAPSAARWSAPWHEHWRAAAAARTVDGGITIGGGLAVWNTGRAVHAVTIAAGRPAWPRHGDARDAGPWNDAPRDTAIFPRGLAAAGPPQAPGMTKPGAVGRGPTGSGGPPTVAGSRCHAVVVLGDGSQRLACLDISPAAEGRIVWTAAAQSLGAAIARLRRAEGGASPSGAAAGAAVFFAGEPAADHELCAVVVGVDGAAAGRFLAVFRAADGRLAWIRRAASGGTSSAEPVAAAERPWLVEDRIVVATPGGVTAFDRQGAVVWTRAAADSDMEAGASSLSAFLRDRIIVAGRGSAGGPDTATAVCLEAAGGAAVWRWSQPGEHVRQLLADPGGGLILVAGTAEAGWRLRRLDVADGRDVTPAAHGDAGGPAAAPAGAVCLGDGTLFVPVMLAPDGRAAGGRGPLAIEVLDPRSLERRRDPVIVVPAAAETTERAEADRAAAEGVALAVGGGRIVWASGGTIGCLSPEPAAVTP